MKTIVLVSFILSPLLLQTSLSAQTEAVGTNGATASPTRQFILVDITGFPFNHTLSGSWQPYQSIRVGYGRNIVDHVEIGVYADYSWFDYDHSEGWAGKFDFSRGNHRSDISVYPAIVFFKFAEIGLGCSYTAQDEVTHIVDGDTKRPITTIDPAENKFGMYFHFGVGGTIHIAGPIGISLGVLFRTDVPNGINTGCRAGIKAEI